MNLEEVSKVQKKTSILFLDVSSSCTGYAVAECDWETRSANIKETGALWFDPKWSHQNKYHYIGKAIMEYFYVTGRCDYIVHESYAVNPNQMGGVLVVPEMLGAIKFAAAENGIGIDCIPPQTWRKHCGIKPDVTEVKGKKKRDYKEPAKRFVLTKTDIPEKIISNITESERNTPSDVYDACGIAYGWLASFKQILDEPFFRQVKFDNLEINNHIGFPFET